MLACMASGGHAIFQSDGLNASAEPWPYGENVLLQYGRGLRTHGSGSNLDSLLKCLRAGVITVAAQGDAAYDKARLCKNRAANIDPHPLAVARVRNVDEVQQAIRCVATSGLEACARAGSHGFGNDAGCSGGVVVDVQDLLSMEVDAHEEVVEFGAGHTLGQLYYKLHASHGLAVPGGPVSSVGAAGLFMGGGRGLFTQIRGLACDSILGIEYVDAVGKVHVANATSNADMYWMVRGGGGSFPGIVTSFRVQAFKAPESFYHIDCHFWAPEGRALMKAWLAKLEDMVQPERHIFTHVTVWGLVNWRFLNVCVDCDAPRRAWFEEAVMGVVLRTGDGHCQRAHNGWIQQLLMESGMNEGVIENSPEALLDRNQGWGNKGFVAARNGGQLLYEYHMSEALIDTLLDWLFGDKALGDHPYGYGINFYPMGGPKVEEVHVDATPYGPRLAKLVMDYKHQWDPSILGEQELMLQHHEEMARALDAYLPCKGFYNYLDNSLPCAKTNEEWLAAYFHDVPRMRQIKYKVDPTGVFRSRLSPSTSRLRSASL